MKKKYRNRKPRYSRPQSKTEVRQELDEAIRVHYMNDRDRVIYPPHTKVPTVADRPGIGSTKFELVLPHDPLPEWFKEIGKEYNGIDWTKHKDYDYGNVQRIDTKPKSHNGLFNKVLTFIRNLYVRVRKSNRN